MKPLMVWQYTAFTLPFSLTMSMEPKCLFLYTNIYNENQGYCSIDLQIYRKRELTRFLQWFIIGNRKLYVEDIGKKKYIDG